MDNIQSKGIFFRALKNGFDVQYGEKVIPFKNYSFCIDWMDNFKAWKDYVTYTNDADILLTGAKDTIPEDLPEYLFHEITAETNIRTLFDQLIDKKEAKKKGVLILNSGLDNNSTLNCLPKELKSMIACTLFAVTKKEPLSSANETTSNTFPAGQ